jgi:hypothetical protein
MGVYMCSTGKHFAFISVSPMQAFTCGCPPFKLPSSWSKPLPRKRRGVPTRTGEEVTKR